MKVTDKFRCPERSRERGVTMVLVALAMVAIIAMAAMSIDLVTLYLAREEAQRAADAAALAAARIISVSGITGTADPLDNPPYWAAICGGLSGWATQAAQTAAAQNTVGGQAVTVTVSYSDGTTTSPDCSILSAVFAVNPLVMVQVTPVSIPSFFSRIWGSTGNNISASATAEAFNPSASDVNGIVPTGNVTPVEPRCVKPWIIPNVDPANPANCTGTGCKPIVSLSDGQIQHPGISTDGSGSAGIIGEVFNLYADCSPTTGQCFLLSWPNPPQANALSPPDFQPNLEYLPGSVQAASQAVPACASGGSNYEMAVAGCDQTTVYQCGQQVSFSGNPNMVDLSENPGGTNGDTALGLACSLTGSATVPLEGQDTLRTTGANPYPFVAIAGDANPLKISGAPITSSNSIVSFPIYDQTANFGRITRIGTTPVTIVGFLQVFVNQVNSDGSVNVTVLNVAGCGSNGPTNAPVFGSSPLPVRLIQPH